MLQKITLIDDEIFKIKDDNSEAVSYTHLTLPTNSLV